MNEGKGSTYELLKRFDDLSYKNKVMLTHKNYKEFKSSYYIKGFEDREVCDFLFGFEKNSVRRYYEQFDIIKFLNR